MRPSLFERRMTLNVYMNVHHYDWLCARAKEKHVSLNAIVRDLIEGAMNGGGESADRIRALDIQPPERR